MFEQHPVPQQISSYQFRLVGDMTIKQFFQIAGGAVIALIFYALPLPSFLRWPLVISSLILGAAFAFLPIQERPMEEWIAAFFRSIYSPTIFFWDPTVTKQQFFAAEGALQPTAAPATKQTDVPVDDQSVAALEIAEKSALSKLTGMFSHKTSAPAPVPTPAPAPTPAVQDMQMSVASTAPIQETTTEPELVKEMVIPTIPAPEIVNKGFEMSTPVAPVAPVQQEQIPQTLSGSVTIDTQAAQFSPDAAPPMTPESPNLISGQVMSADKHIVEGAILEIKDIEGRSVRALKTNKAGHFFIVTPLSDGEYKIEIEKDGLKFEPLSITMKGEIIPPIAVTAES